MVLMFSLKQKKRWKFPPKTVRRQGARESNNNNHQCRNNQINRYCRWWYRFFFVIVVVVGRTFLSLFHRMTIFIRARCRYVLICLIDIISFTDNGWADKCDWFNWHLFLFPQWQTRDSWCNFMVYTGTCPPSFLEQSISAFTTVEGWAIKIIFELPPFAPN